MGKNTVVVTDSSFADDVLNSDKLVLVDFWAEWCGPCRMVAPVLEEIASDHAETLTIAKLNVDENPATARDFNVQGIPTLILFKGGEAVKQIVGAKPKAALLRQHHDRRGRELLADRAHLVHRAVGRRRVLLHVRVAVAARQQHTIASENGD